MTGMVDFAIVAHGYEGLNWDTEIMTPFRSIDVLPDDGFLLQYDGTTKGS
jgi:hypothetical protein